MQVQVQRCYQQELDAQKCENQNLTVEVVSWRARVRKVRDQQCGQYVEVYKMTR